MLILDSIGFSGTSSITSKLNEGFKNIYVTHGTRNILTKTPLGIDDLAPREFILGMKKIEREQKKNVIAVHCLYSPSELIPLCKEMGVEYKTLVREPVKQIFSCFSYSIKKILEGDENILREIDNFKSEYGKFFLRNKIPNNLPNKVYFYAVRRVLNFNLEAAQMRTDFCRMEDILNYEDIFLQTFNIKEPPVKKNFLKSRKNSHTRFYQSLLNIAPNMFIPNYKIILSALEFVFDGKIMNISSFGRYLGYKF